MKNLPVDIRDLIVRMRLIGSDNQTCEVKQSVRKLPDNLVESLSAFSNRQGGIVILGLTEQDGFTPAKGFDAQKIYSSLLELGDKLTPACRFDVDIYPFESAQIVVARIPAMDLSFRPCYVTSQGIYRGSYIRTGDGDRRLTEYEVNRLRESGSQPKYDLEPVSEAKLDDLNWEVLEAVVSHHRVATPRYFGQMPSNDILMRLGALAFVDGVLCPTLAGLLVAGKYPQQYFPRLNVTFTVYPGTTKSQAPGEPMRYLDTQSINGSISEILLDSVAMLKKNMRTGALIDGALREEVTDYPLLAFREALINALQHRDYSHAGRGAQVQVNMFSDRLEILSPGGLYGASSIDSMSPGISSTRNVNLSRLLEATPSLDGVGERKYVIENRGTGLLQIRDSLNHALMPPAKIEDYVSGFSITFSKRKLTEQELSPTRWENVEVALLHELKKRSSLSVSDFVQLSGLNRRTISKYLNQLVEANLIERTEPLRSPKQRYRLKSGK